MQQYLDRVEDIEGWFDHEKIVPLLEAVDRFQKEDHSEGNVCEIGVHHGKSFIPMSLLLGENEYAIALDCFEDQKANVDGSGDGSRGAFDEWVKNIGDKDRTIVTQCDSQKIDGRDVLSMCSNGLKNRIFSIDGCHTAKATYWDMMTAMSSSCNNGIILVDDYGNNDWPGVRYTVDQYLHKHPVWLPVYLGADKIVLAYEDVYQTWLERLKEVGKNELEWFESRQKLAGVWRY